MTNNGTKPPPDVVVHQPSGRKKHSKGAQHNNRISNKRGGGNVVKSTKVLTSKKPSSIKDSNSNESIESLEKKLLDLNKIAPDSERIDKVRRDLINAYTASPASLSMLVSTLNVSKLWKSVYYPSISHFRKLIEKSRTLQKNAKAASLSGASASSNTASTTTTSANMQYERAKNRLRDYIDCIKKELEQLRDFIESVAETQPAMGRDSDSELSSSPSQDSNINESPQSANEDLAKKFTKQRTQIYVSLGDLLRYKTSYCTPSDAPKSYADSTAYYLKALSINPSSGLIHNQLAVLAHYEDNELEAIYRYFRSLAVETPFPSAKENLGVIFEKNRQNNEQLLKEDNPNHLKRFILEFVRIHGILFTKISVEMINEIQRRVLRDFEQMLDESLISSELMTKLFIMNIFQIDHTLKRLNRIEGNKDTTSSSNSVIILLRHASNLALNMFARLLSHSVGSSDTSAVNTQYFAAISIFMRYMSLHQSRILQQHKDGVIESNDNVSYNSYKNTLSLVWNMLVRFLNVIRVDGILGPDEAILPVLPEDRELKGFLPLLSLSHKCVDSANADEVTPQERVDKVRSSRCLQIGLKLANEKNIALNFSNVSGFSTHLKMVTPRDTVAETQKPTRGGTHRRGGGMFVMRGRPSSVKRRSSRANNNTIPLTRVASPPGRDLRALKKGSKAKFSLEQKTPIPEGDWRRKNPPFLVDSLGAATQQVDETNPKSTTQVSSESKRDATPTPPSAQDASFMFFNFGGKPLKENDVPSELLSGLAQQNQNEPQPVQSQQSSAVSSQSPSFTGSPVPSSLNRPHSSSVQNLTASSTVGSPQTWSPSTVPSNNPWNRPGESASQNPTTWGSIESAGYAPAPQPVDSSWGMTQALPGLFSSPTWSSSFMPAPPRQEMQQQQQQAPPPQFQQPWNNQPFMSNDLFWVASQQPQQPSQQGNFTGQNNNQHGSFFSGGDQT